MIQSKVFKLKYFFFLHNYKIFIFDHLKVVRKLQDFESPYISLQAANKIEKHKLLIRKSYK